MQATNKIQWKSFSEKHKRYIAASLTARMMVAEGAIRSGKTIDNCICAAMYIETCADKIHLASGSTIGNAKLNIGECNGFGLEHLFRGRCRWGKFKDNEALIIHTQTGEKIVVFAGGGQADSYKRILGNSYGMWIATEINEHFDSENSKESFIKVAFGRQLAAVRSFVLWDLNPDNPGAPIYENYIDAYKTTMTGYVYEHFTINDNLAIPQENKNALIEQYDPTSIWYRRDILGERCVAQGLCYPTFANDPDRFIVDILTIDDIMQSDGCSRDEAARRLPKTNPDIMHVVLGVDFGGTRSGHSFTANAFTRGYKSVFTVDDHYHNNMKDGRINATQLAEQFITFAQRVKARYPVYEARCDSAEQTLIAELVAATMRAKLNINIQNALKLPINERIRFYNVLMSSGRYFIDKRCKTTIKALKEARYDPKQKTQDVRLDNGTTNIDSLDSLEYTTEPVQRDIITIGGFK